MEFASVEKWMIRMSISNVFIDRHRIRSNSLWFILLNYFLLSTSITPQFVLLILEGVSTLEICILITNITLFTVEVESRLCLIFLNLDLCEMEANVISQRHCKWIHIVQFYSFLFLLRMLVWDTRNRIQDYNREITSHMLWVSED